MEGQTTLSTSNINIRDNQSVGDENPIRQVTDKVHETQTDEKSSQKTKSIGQNGSWEAQTEAKKEKKSQDSERRMGNVSSDKVNSLCSCTSQFLRKSLS